MGGEPVKDTLKNIPKKLNSFMKEMANDFKNGV